MALAHTRRRRSSIALLTADDGEVQVVTVGGELDLSTVAQLDDYLAQLDPGRPVVLDLHHLTFLDSTGLSVLIDNMHRVRATGGTLTIRRPSPPVARTLEVTGLLESFGLPASGDWTA